MGAVPARRVGESFAGPGIDQGDLFLAETEGCLDGFGEASTLRGVDFQAILNNLNDSGKPGDGGRFVRTLELSVNPDAQVSLLLEKGEEIHRGTGWWHGRPFVRFGTGGDRKGDEHPSPGKIPHQIRGD